MSNRWQHGALCEQDGLRKTLPVKLAVVSGDLLCVLLVRRSQTRDTIVVAGLKDASDTIRRYASTRWSGKRDKGGCVSYARRCAGQDKQPVWQLDVVKGEGEVGLSSSLTHTPSAQSSTLMGVWSVWTILFVLACRICAAVSRFASTVNRTNNRILWECFFFFWEVGEDKSTSWSSGWSEKT